MMPTQKPGKSKQDYQTPENFLNAAKELLGIDNFFWDLAADSTNTVCPQGHFFTKEDDALTLGWFTEGWNWLNPPFADITPWVRKAHFERNSGVKTAVLVPASVGSKWWTNWVAGTAHGLFLDGRIKFIGCPDVYPKDLALLLYSPYITGGYSTFHWQKLTKTPKI